MATRDSVSELPREKTGSGGRDRFDYCGIRERDVPKWQENTTKRGSPSYCSLSCFFLFCFLFFSLSFRRLLANFNRLLTLTHLEWMSPFLIGVGSSSSYSTYRDPSSFGVYIRDRVALLFGIVLCCCAYLVDTSRFSLSLSCFSFLVCGHTCHSPVLSSS